MHYQYLCIEGNIGAGKTSLATQIARRHNARLILEQFEDNPFLPKFYSNPSKYAFPLELTFLASRFQQLKNEFSSSDMFSSFIVSDYFIQKSLIFARGTIFDDELALYIRLFNIITATLPRPDLMVYLFLGTDRLLENIRYRGRSYEQNIEASYLDRIQEGYFDFIRQQQGMRILVIDTSNIDFVNREEDLERIEAIIFKDYEIGVHRIVME